MYFIDLDLALRKLAQLKEMQSPSRFGSVARVSDRRLKGPVFDSCQGHVPWL